MRRRRGEWVEGADTMNFTKGIRKRRLFLFTVFSSTTPIVVHILIPSGSVAKKDGLGQDVVQQVYKHFDLRDRQTVDSSLILV